MKISLKDLALPLVIMSFCVLMYIASFYVEDVYLDPEAIGPMAYPRVLLGMMFCLAPLLVFSKKEKIDWDNFKKAVAEISIILIVMVCYGIALKFLGFLISGFAMLFFIFKILGYEGVLKPVVFAVCITFVFWYLFANVVKLALPSGTLFMF